MVNLIFQKNLYLDSSRCVHNFYHFFLSRETEISITDNGSCVVTDVNTMRHTISQQQLVNGKVSKGLCCSIDLNNMRHTITQFSIKQMN